jgi:hypothetical protein
MLAGRSQCAALRRGHTFLFERRGGLLGHARRGNRAARTLTSYLPSLFYPICIPCYVRVSSPQRNHMYYQDQTQNSGGIRKQRLHVILGATISLGNVGLIRGFLNGLRILQGELYPSARILLELLQVFCRLSKDYRLIRPRYRTYRKSFP